MSDKCPFCGTQVESTGALWDAAVKRGLVETQKMTEAIELLTKSAAVIETMRLVDLYHASNDVGFDTMGYLDDLQKFLRTNPLEIPEEEVV